jgi:uroporphyrinogen III methyltransferase/synthase
VVVRLKGGDPFVFGRGGEECEALHAAGVRFEVVPGVTAAIAAACYAGIPVTHRDFNSSFTVVTGHEKEQEYREDEAKSREPGAATDMDWGALAKLPCLAFYMGVKALPRICERLIAHGMDAETEAAVIQWGTLPRQRVVTGTLAGIAVKVQEARITPPALTIVGKVVSLRPVMNWFEKRPLFGQTIVVTRTRHQASELAEKLSELGAAVIEAPTIEVAPPADWSNIDDAFVKIGTFDWVIFTSANGVEATLRRMREKKLDARSFVCARIAVVGDATAQAVEELLCLNVDLVPESFVAEALADELIQRNQVAGKRFLLLRADIARPILVEKLVAAGAEEVRDVAVYETRPASALPKHLTEELEAGRVTWVTFTSSSTARNFTALLGADYREKLKGIRLASIGPVTTAAIHELGLEPAAVAERSDVDGLVQAIIKGCGK